MHHTDLPHPTPAPRRHAAPCLHAAAPCLAVARAVRSIIFTDTDVSAVGIGAVTGETAEASVLNVLLFTLSGSHAVTGQMQFEIAGPAKMAGSMELSLEGGASLLSATLDTLTAPLDFALTLGPGTYRFVGQAGLQQNGLLPDDARVQYLVAMSFAELGDPDNDVPGNAVPEPASLALALSGLLACGVVRRRQRPVQVRRAGRLSFVHRRPLPSQ